ncbi:TetR/AcrR family transcriptional regulator [Actinomyces sp.]|jgi:transcriptional regulator, tetR family
MSNDAQATSTRRPGRPKAGSEDKKARILAEALTLFSTRGYVGTSLADIARASDISKAGLLHHYSSKDQLLAAVLDERDRRTMSRLPGGDAGAEVALDAWVEMVAHNQRHPDGVALYTAMSAAVIDADHQAHPWFRQHLMGAIAYLVDALERGKATGEVRADAPSEQIARKLVALSDGLQIQWLCARVDGGRDVDMRGVTAGVVADVKDRWLVRS